MKNKEKLSIIKNLPRKFVNQNKKKTKSLFLITQKWNSRDFENVTNFQNRKSEMFTLWLAEIFTSFSKASRKVKTSEAALERGEAARAGGAAGASSRENCTRAALGALPAPRAGAAPRGPDPQRSGASGPRTSSHRGGER